MIEKLNGRVKHPLLRKLGYAGAYAVAFSPVAAMIGITQATHEDRFGANTATYGFKLDPESYLDFGPLGTGRSPERFGPIALEGTVHEIPASSGDSTSAISGVVTSYAFEFDNFNEVHRPIIIHELLKDAAYKSAYAELGWLAFVAAGSVGIVPSFRRRLTPLAIAAVSVGTMAGTLEYENITEKPLPGTEVVVSGQSLKVTGLSGELTLSTLIPTIENFIDRKDTQREEFVSSVNSQLDASSELMQQRNEGDRLILAYSDLHCSLAEASVLRHAQEIYAAPTIVNAGDITTNGLEVEKKCIEIIDAIDDPVADSGGEKVEAEQLADIGNHDSKDTSDQLKDSDVVYLNGETHETKDFSVLGDDDPERTPAFASGADTRFSRDHSGETEEEAGEKLAKQSQKDDPDIVVVHEPEEADAFVAAGGKATLLINGHDHQLRAPKIITTPTGTIYSFDPGTAGGIGEQTIDNLNFPLSLPSKVATFMAIRLGADGSLYYQTVSVTPAAEVTVSPWTFLDRVSDPATITEEALVEEQKSR
jgi:predicted MPP superfamily phosphohydrolase